MTSLRFALSVCRHVPKRTETIKLLGAARLAYSASYRKKDYFIHSNYKIKIAY